MSDLQLYHLSYCPYCKRVLKALNNLDFNVDLNSAKATKGDTVITLKEIDESETFNSELINGGGKRGVPCLRTLGADNEWMYESSDIIKHLEKLFS